MDVMILGLLMIGYAILRSIIRDIVSIFPLRVKPDYTTKPEPPSVYVDPRVYNVGRDRKDWYQCD